MADPRKHNPMRLSDTQNALDRLADVEARFAQAKEGLEHTQRLATLGTLSAMVAHEYNNILSTIIGYTQMALASPDDIQLTRKALEKALSGAQRAEKITTSLLGYAKEEQGVADTQLKPALDSVLSYLGPSLRSDRIELNLDLEEVSVAMPRINIEQVLLNLMLNARKAMQQQRGGTLKIQAKTHKNTVRISLSDTGGGVPPEIADRLFEPFITHDPAHGTPGADSNKGCGLGLSICKDLVQKAGGTLRFESTPGQGTTFHLEFPQPSPLRQSA